MVADVGPSAASPGEPGVGISRVYSPGERIDRYEVLGLLGRGGMAVVYSVRRRGVGDFDRSLALKMMLPHLVDDEAYLAMFLDEIRIASRIEHPHVVRVLDVGEHEGSPFMVMELLRGRTLHTCITRGAPRPLIATWLAQVGEGLHAAHEARDSDGTWLRIVHRDVSAANVHVGLDGRARVLDFGIAGAVGRATATQHGELKGRLSMMAPEAITRNVPIDRRADVWSLGVLAWQSFSGAQLFRGENEAETLWRVLNAPVPRLPDDVPAAVRDAIASCLERDASRRLGSTAELSAILAEYARQEGVTEELPSGWMRRTFNELVAEAPLVSDTEPDAGPTRAEPVAPVSSLAQSVPARTDGRRAPLAIAALLSSAALGALALYASGALDPAQGEPGDAATSVAAPAPPARVEVSPVASPTDVDVSPAASDAAPLAEPAPIVAPSPEPVVVEPRARPRRSRPRRDEGAASGGTERRVEGRLLGSPYGGGG